MLQGVQLFVGNAMQCLQLADEKVVAARRHKGAHHADIVAPAHTPRLVQQSFVRLETELESEAGVDLVGGVQIPPGEAKLHRAPVVAGLGTVDVLGLYLLEGAGHQLTVGHGEIHRAEQAAAPHDAVPAAGDHQEAHDDHQQHPVQTLSHYKAPDERRQRRNQQDAVDHVHSEPQIFQLAHGYSP